MVHFNFTLMVILLMMMLAMTVRMAHGALQFHISGLGKGCKVPARRAWPDATPRSRRKKNIKSILNICGGMPRGCKLPSAAIGKERKRKTSAFCFCTLPPLGIVFFHPSPFSFSFALAPSLFCVVFFTLPPPFFLVPSRLPLSRLISTMSFVPVVRSPPPIVLRDPLVFVVPPSMGMVKS